MTGGIFKKDDTAPLQAKEKPRLNWRRYAWIALVGVLQFGTDRSQIRGKDDGDIIGAYFTFALVAAILIFRMWRRIKPYRNRASGVLDETEQRD